MNNPVLPEFRQLVLLTGDLEGTLQRAREKFNVPNGFRDEVALAKIGMKHEVFGFDRTYVEVCEPTNPESSAAQSVAKKGDSGFMVCVQVEDSEAMLARAKAEGLEPIVNKDHHGTALTQWHPRDFGTIAEFDQMPVADSWHFAPDIYEARSNEVIGDIVAVDLSVADPAAMARRWANVSGAEVGEDGTSVKLSTAVVRFTAKEGVRGVYSVDCHATDRTLAGEVVTLGGVGFNLL